MDFDLKQWLVKDLGFSEEKATTLLPEFQDKADKLAGFGLRQSDYDRKMNAIKAEFEAKNEQLNKEIAEWAAAKSEDSTETESLRTRAQETERQMLALRQAAEAAGVTLPAPGSGTPPPPATPAVDATPPPDLKPYLRQDQFAPFADFMLTLPAELQAIAQEHHALFGEALDTRKIVAEIKTRAAKKDPNLDPRSIWESSFNVPAKRDEVSKLRHDAEIKAAEDRGFQRATTEHALPGAQPVGQHSPVLTRQAGQESHLKRPQPQQRISSATEAFATGRYRTPAAGAAGK